LNKVNEGAKVTQAGRLFSASAAITWNEWPTMQDYWYKSLCVDVIRDANMVNTHTHTWTAFDQLYY